jgi:hypothetical protein
MNHETVETRLTILERDVDRLMQLEDTIHKMDKKLDGLANRSSCPAPGMCLTLEPRVRLLEDERNKAIGGFKTLVFIGTLVGSVGGWFLAKLTGTH